MKLWSQYRLLCRHWLSRILDGKWGISEHSYPQSFSCIARNWRKGLSACKAAALPMSYGPSAPPYWFLLPWIGYECLLVSSVSRRGQQPDFILDYVQLFQTSCSYTLLTAVNKWVFRSLSPAAWFTPHISRVWNSAPIQRLPHRSVDWEEVPTFKSKPGSIPQLKLRFGSFYNPEISCLDNPLIKEIFSCHQLNKRKILYCYYGPSFRRGQFRPEEDGGNCPYRKLGL